MPRTHRSGRVARVAAVVRADRPRSTSSAVWASARRWLVVAGLLSGAWFAGAACAAADEGGPVAAPADNAGTQQEQQDEGQAVSQDLAGAVEGAASAASGGDDGGSAADDSHGRPGDATDGTTGESNADAGPAASGDVDAAAADPVGTAADSADSASAAATGADGSADPDSGPDQQRPEDSSVRPDEKRRPAAVDRLGDTVAAVGEVGGSAGRTVPVSVSHSRTPDPAAVVSEAAAATAGDRADGLPGLDLGGFDPSDMADAVTLPAFEPDQADGSSGRAPAPGTDSATRGHDDAPTAAAGPKPEHHAAAAFADHIGPAVYTDSTGDPGAEPNAVGADRADAAAVGSAVNTSQFGGVCVGYLPAAASAAPAAGSLQCARQALADVPRDFGERPTFSPD